MSFSHLNCSFLTKSYQVDSELLPHSHPELLHYLQGCYERLTPEEHPCERASHTSSAGSCRELAEVIGQHVVVKLVFLDGSCRTPGVKALFGLIPILKFDQDACVYLQKDSQAAENLEVVMYEGFD